MISMVHMGTRFVERVTRGDLKAMIMERRRFLGNMAMGMGALAGLGCAGQEILKGQKKLTS